MEALLYFTIWAGLIFLMMRFGCGSHVMGHRHRQQDARRKDAAANSDQLRWIPPQTDVDPVCGKTIRTSDAKSAVHRGTVYYFCSPEHREVFEAAPHLYVGPTSHPPTKQMDHVHG